VRHLRRHEGGDLLTLDVVDVSTQGSEVADVPTLALNRPGVDARISWQGLPAGFEFATVVDAIERASSGQIGLTRQSSEALGRLTQPVEVMVFATPT
jgi:alkyl hydroperoxide reductase subunit AhpF